MDVEKDIIHQARIRAYTLDPEIQINKVKAIMQALIHYTISNIKEIPVADEILEKKCECRPNIRPLDTQKIER